MSSGIHLGRGDRHNQSISPIGSVLSVFLFAQKKIRDRNCGTFREQNCGDKRQQSIQASHWRVIDATGKYLIPGLWDMHVLRTEFESTYPRIS